MKPSAERIYLSVPHIGEASFRYVKEAFASNWMSTVGPHVTALETALEDLLGCPTAALSCGTAGLHLALRLAGVGPGDEVVTPTLSFVATANPILYQRATPVFMDSERATWNLDPNLLDDFLKKRAAVNSLPKAVIVVHLFGQPASLDPILQLCRQYGLPLIEDAAESLGSLYRGRHPGTFGELGVFSFNGNKMITGTTGGMLVTRNRIWADKARKWRAQAPDGDAEDAHNYVHSELGYTYAMSNVVAGIVRGQLGVLEERVRARRAVFARYVKGLAEMPGIEPQPEAEGCRHSRWLSCFVVDEHRFGMNVYDIVRFLESKNVESRPVWRPMHLQPLYQDCEVIGGEVAADLNRHGICLPSSSSLTEEQQDLVIGLIREASRAEV